MIKWILVLILFFPISASAFAPWSRQDIALESTYVAIHILDWGTTLDIADNPSKYYEYNPILGRHPSREKVNLFFAAGIPLHLGITYALPKRWRPYWQYFSIGMNGICVINNFSIGLKLSF